MAAGRCRYGRGPARVLDRYGKPRWHPLWRGNHAMAEPLNPYEWTVMDGPGCRPYIDYDRTTKERWAYKSYRPTPAYLPWLNPDARGKGRIILEPNLKPNASPNKQWGWHRWQALANLGAFAQMGTKDARRLDGVEFIETHSFEEACGVLARASAAILPEGGLHHAAAAIGIPTVVLWGGMVSPRQTGYESQINLAIDDPEALGWRVPHSRCLQAWSLITVADVVTALEKALRMRVP